MQRMLYKMLSSRQLLCSRSRSAGKGPRAQGCGTSPLLRAVLAPRGRAARGTTPQRLITVNAAALEVEPLDAGAAGFASSALSPMSWPARSHCVAELVDAQEGSEAVICGWVDRNRNLGGLGFLDVRDHTGLLQVGRLADCCQHGWSGRSRCVARRQRCHLPVFLSSCPNSNNSTPAGGV